MRIESPRAYSPWLATGLASIKYKIPIWGSEISCAELHFVPVPRSLLRGASIWVITWDPCSSLCLKVNVNHNHACNSTVALRCLCSARCIFCMCNDIKPAARQTRKSFIILLLNEFVIVTIPLFSEIPAAANRKVRVRDFPSSVYFLSNPYPPPGLIRQDCKMPYPA